MWIVYIAVLIGLAGVVIAVIKIGKNMSNQRKEPIISEKAEVVKMRSDTRSVTSSGASTVDTSGSYEQTSYHLTFKLKSGKSVTFKVGKKLYLKLSEHQTGMLTFKGYKLIKFEYEGYPINTMERKELNHTAFFTKKKHTNPTVLFYGELKDLDINYHSDQKISCDQLELNRLIDQLSNQSSENFFALEDHEQNILEISNNGKTDDFEIIYMKANSVSRFIGYIKGNILLKKVIDSYFKNENLIDIYGLKEE
ncbi:MAG: DUF2500 domain-containing protein [Acholeplasmataceae bacterium]|nr:DUF2500 domain-containing protein [Acholeplasmataceae bacterium]